MSKVLSRRRVVGTPQGVYKYEVEIACPECKKTRWVRSFRKSSSLLCKSCAGRKSYVPAKIERHDKLKLGNGYITKQGYHLVYDGTKYVPAQRLAFPNLPPDKVVHHIDGDKLNNVLDNLIPLSKTEHRQSHNSLQNVAMSLVRLGLIKYDRNTNSYSLSSSMRKLIELISVKTGEVLTDDAEGNPVPSPMWGRCNDYPVEEYIRSLMEVRSTQTE